jgi:hypothetical protein
MSQGSESSGPEGPFPEAPVCLYHDRRRPSACGMALKEHGNSVWDAEAARLLSSVLPNDTMQVQPMLASMDPVSLETLGSSLLTLRHVPGPAFTQLYMEAVER